jgi:(R,R)-butanediol dehydrogenase/meso-butanediol dehydrogenase/diacetyl reductase
MALGASTFLADADNTVADAVEAAGGPPRIVFEAAGVSGALAQSVRIVGARGTVVVLGCCTVPDEFVPAWGLLKEVRLQFANLYTAGEFEHTIGMLGSDPVGPRKMVTSTVSLTELPTMFESLRQPTEECKVLLDPQM